MATITYSSFPDSPHFSNEHSSSSKTPTHNQLPRMDAPVPIDLNVVDISEMASEGDCANAMNHLDSIGFHLSHSTPTKERARRATMPDSMKPSLQEVPVPHSAFVLFLV
jgi:hypothetical protein